MSLIVSAGLLVLLAGCSDSGTSKGAGELVEQARQFMAEGKTRHALIKLKESVQDDPDNAQARLLLAQIYLHQGEASNAEIEIKKAIKLGVEREQWVPVLGRSLLLQSRFDAVLSDIKEEAQDNNKIKGEIALMKGDAYVAKKQLEQARERFSQALLYEPAMLGPIYGLARVSIENKDYVRGLEYLDKVLSQDANHLAAIIKKGDVFLHGGDKAQALALYDRAVKAQPTSLEALLKRAYVLVGMGRMQDAQQDVVTTLKLYPNSTLAHYLNARVYFSQGDIDKASDALQEVFSIQQDYRPAQLLNGIVAIAKARYRLAEQSLERQLAVDKGHLLSVKLLALTHIHLGNAEKVLERLAGPSTGLRLDREALAIVGVAALRAGDAKRGESALKASFVLRSSTQEGGQGSASTDNNDTASDGDMLQEKKIFKQFFMQVMNAEIKNLLKDTKPGADAFYQAGLIRMSLGEMDVARDHFNEALARGFDQAEVQMALAQIAIKKQQWSEAKTSLALVLDKKPKDVTALVTMTRVLEKAGDNAQTVQWLKQTWESDADALAVGLALFKHYLQDKKLALAGGVTESLYSNHADNPKLTETVAKLYANAGYPVEAVALLEEKVKVKGARLEDRLLLADMLARQGELAESGALYNKALAKDANNRYALMGLVRLHIKAKEYDKASKVAQRLLGVEPDLPLAYQVQARIATLQGQHPQAVKLYVQAMQKGENEQLLVAYVNALMKNNDRDQAVLESRNWLFRHPAHHRVRFLLAGIYQESGKIDKAIDEYLLLVDSPVFQMVALNNLIWLFMDSNDARLNEYLARLVQMKPDAPEIMDTIGWAYLQTDKKEKAGEYLQKAAEKLKDNLSVQYHLAVYFNAIGEIPKARKILSAIVSAGGVFAEKQDAEKLLSTL